MTYRDQDFQKENIIYRNVDGFAHWLASVLKTFDGSAQSLTVYLGALRKLMLFPMRNILRSADFIQKAEILKAIHSRSSISRMRTAKSFKI